jgi:hypothetical protein
MGVMTEIVKDRTGAGWYKPGSEEDPNMDTEDGPFVESFATKAEAEAFSQGLVWGDEAFFYIDKVVRNDETGRWDVHFSYETW